MVAASDEGEEVVAQDDNGSRHAAFVQPRLARR